MGDNKPLKKYHSWFAVSRKLHGILYPYTDPTTSQEIVDKLFESLNKAHDKHHFIVRKVCDCGSMRQFK